MDTDRWFSQIQRPYLILNDMKMLIRFRDKFSRHKNKILYIYLMTFFFVFLFRRKNFERIKWNSYSIQVRRHLVRID